jgi:hypothetical protein
MNTLIQCPLSRREFVWVNAWTKSTASQEQNRSNDANDCLKAFDKAFPIPPKVEYTGVGDKPYEGY